MNAFVEKWQGHWWGAVFSLIVAVSIWSTVERFIYTGVDGMRYGTVRCSGCGSRMSSWSSFRCLARDYCQGCAPSISRRPISREDIER